jgi:nitrate/nitrite-specific signal transduction histidine kinase
LPLGTIARLVAEESNIEGVRFGSISSLYQSVADLDEKYLCHQNCKEMLLKLGNSMEAYCQKLKLNIDDTPVQYFFCKCSESITHETKECLSSILGIKNAFAAKYWTENYTLNI